MCCEKYINLALVGFSVYDRVVLEEVLEDMNGQNSGLSPIDIY